MNLLHLFSTTRISVKLNVVRVRRITLKLFYFAIKVKIVGDISVGKQLCNGMLIMHPSEV